MFRAIRHMTLALSLLAAGCTQFPQLDQTITPQMEAAPFPKLVPVDPLLANIRTSGVDPVQTQNALQARVARLRARAARLRGSVLTGPERQRLARGLQ